MTTLVKCACCEADVESDATKYDPELEGPVCMECWDDFENGIKYLAKFGIQGCTTTQA